MIPHYLRFISFVSLCFRCYDTKVSSFLISLRTFLKEHFHLRWFFSFWARPFFFFPFSALFFSSISFPFFSTFFFFFFFFFCSLCFSGVFKMHRHSEAFHFMRCELLIVFVLFFFNIRFIIYHLVLYIFNF